MTAFMESLLTTAKALKDRTHSEYMETPPGDSPDWDMLERRFACAMIQARAQQCRQLATNLMVAGKPQLLSEAPLDLRLALSMSIDKIIKAFIQSSHDLEQIGMDIAQGPWPPVEVEEQPTGLVM